MTFATYTLGCKVNQYETEAVSEIMVKRGYKSVPFDCCADIYIINTCSVTAAADAKNRNVIRQAFRKNPSAVIVVTGCYGQSAGEKLIGVEGVSIVTGTNNRSEIPDMIERYLMTGEKILKADAVDFHSMDYEDLSVDTITGHTRAFVKIQDGCTQFCSYCIIPFTRGAQRSRSLTDLKSEIERLADAGYKEIVLTGINMTSYGRDLKDGTDLVSAVETVASVEGIMRVRFSSLEPMYFTEETIAKLSNIDKFCRHFHLAIQSGSDSVLKRMNRHYTTEDFLKITETVRKYMPDSAFTTDIMVGFPGETDEEHKESMNFARKIGFSRMHVFPYSRRQGTVADKMKDQIPPNVKKARAKEMGDLAFELKEEFTKSLYGTLQDVLLEEYVPGKGMKGFASNYCEVIAKDCTAKRQGDIVKVLITGSEGDICLGETV